MADTRLPAHYFEFLAQKLCNLDPDLYEELVRGFVAYANELTAAVTYAPPDQIFICQGRAQTAEKFARAFKERHDPKTP